MFTDRFGRNIYPGYDYSVFEVIPEGRENAIYQYELLVKMDEKFGIKSIKELKQILNDMYINGYIIIRAGLKNQGKYYRFKSLIELESELGLDVAEWLINDPYYKI